MASSDRVKLHKVIDKTNDFVLGVGDSPESPSRRCFMLVNTKYQVVEAWGFSESLARISLPSVQLTTEESRKAAPDGLADMTMLGGTH